MSDDAIEPTEDNGAPAAEKGDRIAKVLARAGLCSRRDAERWIEEGRVAVDGQVLTTPAVVVTPGSIILVDGKPIKEPEPSRLWRYHKPAGLVTSHRDEKGRPTLFESLPPELGRVISVGRLDLNSEGLLLLTNDGELARKLELPATGWVRRYKVRVHGAVDPERFLPLAQGIVIDGVRYGEIKVEFERQKGSNAWVTVALTEGKNREIRRVFEHLGYVVTRLIRLSYGPFQLGLLPRGAIEEVPRRVLRDQLGLGAAKDKGATTRKMLSLKDKPAAEPAKARVRPPKPHRAVEPPPKRGRRAEGRAQGDPHPAAVAKPVGARATRAAGKTESTRKPGGPRGADRRR
ncbi:pseudouridine synthase [Aliidongia dinghuensis]|uniref:Pseudouridine synthase n=1 Tax=Aliidongia dinghuensis TaxID=1867774 RepID=A0A8J2YT35_9PROT|nr:pseudouridine synthase [Aliidongia dinghuensis]GGF16023.1 pseudouridine synthase [Aliidongia dinghuensis]